MKHPFGTTADAILVKVEFDGPTGVGTALLVLDTGAATTVIAPLTLMQAGYGPATPTKPIQVVSASGVVNAAILEVAALRALGQEAKNFPVIAHPLPKQIGVDGVLGLDFFRGKELVLDFRAGFITLN